MRARARVMYVERCASNSDGPAWIGWVAFSKSGKTIRYRGLELARWNGVTGNHVELRRAMKIGCRASRRTERIGTGPGAAPSKSMMTLAKSTNGSSHRARTRGREFSMVSPSDPAPDKMTVVVSGPVFVRHGSSIALPGTPTADWPLDPEHIADVDHLVDRVPHRSVVVSSDYRRALETGMAFGTPRPDVRLREVARPETENFGDAIAMYLHQRIRGRLGTAGGRRRQNGRGRR